MNEYQWHIFVAHGLVINWQPLQLQPFWKSKVKSQGQKGQITACMSVSSHFTDKRPQAVASLVEIGDPYFSILTVQDHGYGWHMYLV